MARTIASQAAAALHAAQFTAEHAARATAGESVLMVQADHYDVAATILRRAGFALDPIDYSDGEPTYLTAATITKI